MIDLGNGRKEMQKKPIENRNTPLVIPKSNESKLPKIASFERVSDETFCKYAPLIASSICESIAKYGEIDSNQLDEIIKNVKKQYNRTGRP